MVTSRILSLAMLLLVLVGCDRRAITMVKTDTFRFTGNGVYALSARVFLADNTSEWYVAHWTSDAWENGKRPSVTRLPLDRQISDNNVSLMIAKDGAPGVVILDWHAWDKRQTTTVSLYSLRDGASHPLLVCSRELPRFPMLSQNAQYLAYAGRLSGAADPTMADVLVTEGMQSALSAAERQRVTQAFAGLDTGHVTGITDDARYLVGADMVSIDSVRYHWEDIRDGTSGEVAQTTVMNCSYISSHGAIHLLWQQNHVHGGTQLELGDLQNHALYSHWFAGYNEVQWDSAYGLVLVFEHGGIIDPKPMGETVSLAKRVLVLDLSGNTLGDLNVEMPDLDGR